MDTQNYSQNNHQRADPLGVVLPLPQLGRWESPSFLLPSQTQGSSYMLETRKPLYSNCLDLHKFKGCPLLTCCSKSQDLHNCNYQQFQPRKWKDGPLRISTFQLLHSTSNDHNLAHIQKLQNNGLNGGSPKVMSTQNLRM